MRGMMTECFATEHPDELLHGTSLRSLARILAEDRLRVGAIGNAYISTSPNPSVAAYWAASQAECDDRPGVGGRAGRDAEVAAGSAGAVLVLSRAKLTAAGIDPKPFSDPVFGEGACDWEQEEAIDTDVAPLSACLLRVEVDLDAYERLGQALAGELAQVAASARGPLAAFAAPPRLAAPLPEEEPGEAG